MPTSKLNRAQREFTPQYLTGCQLQQTGSHWESFGTRCCFTASWGVLPWTIPTARNSIIPWMSENYRTRKPSLHPSLQGAEDAHRERWRENVWFKSPTAARSPSSVVTQYLGSCEQLNYEASLARTCRIMEKKTDGKREDPDSGL